VYRKIRQRQTPGVTYEVSSFFTGLSLSIRSSSSTLSLSTGNFRFKSAKASRFSQMPCDCIALSFFKVSRFRSDLANSRGYVNSWCKRISLSDDVACDALVLRTALISLLLKQIYDSLRVSDSSPYQTQMSDGYLNEYNNSR
jgi:hypothetical protein